MKFNTQHPVMTFSAYPSELVGKFNTKPSSVTFNIYPPSVNCNAEHPGAKCNTHHPEVKFNSFWMSYAHKHTQTHMHTLTHAHNHTHTLTHTHTHTYTHVLTHTTTHTHSLSHTQEAVRDNDKCSMSPTFRLPEDLCCRTVEAKDSLGGFNQRNQYASQLCLKL